MTAPLDIDGVQRASELDRATEEQRREVAWTREILAGRIGELSGAADAATLTFAFELVGESQRSGEPVAWVTGRETAFFPPDAARRGLDLAALPVVRTPDLAGAARAADKLVRSGGFGLVVVDAVEAGSPNEALPRPLQKRLVRHAEACEVALLFLTAKSPDAPSIGALASFRIQARRERDGRGRFTCRLEALADKRFGPGWSRREVYRGPPGLR